MRALAAALKAVGLAALALAWSIRCSAACGRAAAPTSSPSSPTTARACRSTTRRRRPAAASCCSGCCWPNRRGRRGSGRTSTSAASRSARSCAPSTISPRSRSTASARRSSTTLDSLARRFRGLPVAGVLLLTDGNATDALAADLPWADLPPIYPVAAGDDDELRDVSVERVSASETNFESAPVTIRADVRSIGFDGEPVVVALYDEHGEAVETQTARPEADGDAGVRAVPAAARDAGRQFLQRRRVAPKCEADDGDVDAARERDSVRRSHARQQPPARRGRPRRRAVPRALRQRPAQLGVQVPPPRARRGRPARARRPVRIAKREPKFSFRRRGEQSTNQLFEASSNPDDDAAETLRPAGARAARNRGRGRAARRLSPHGRRAVPLPRASCSTTSRPAFFTQDQLTLIEDFVSRRGGGLLMLGGAESFADGNYRRTPVGDVLPVYLDGAADAARAAARSASSAWRSPAKAGSSRGCGCARPSPRSATGWPRCRRFRRSTPSGDSSPAPRCWPRRRRRRQTSTRRWSRSASAAAGRRRMLVGDLWRWELRRQRRQDDDLDKVVAADGPLARGRRAAARRGRRAGRRPTRRRRRGGRRRPRARARRRVPAARQRRGDRSASRRPTAARSSWTPSRAPTKPGAYVGDARAARAGRLPRHGRGDGARRQRGRRARNRLGRPAAGRRVQPPGAESRAARGDRRQDRGRGRRRGRPRRLRRRRSTAATRRSPSRGRARCGITRCSSWSTIACLAGEWGLRRWKGLA